MNEPSPPLEDRPQPARRVLVLAACPGDEVIGCGGRLSSHAARGDAVVIAVLTGPPDAQRSPSRAAAADPGVAPGMGDVRRFGISRGALGAQTELVARLKVLLDETAPDLVYAPSPLEDDPDRKAASRAIVSALAHGPSRSLLFYGVQMPVPAGVELDARGSHEFVRLSSDELFAADSSAADLVARLGRASAAQSSTTAVVSTWNKKDDVRANLESLRAQTLPFAEIVVVDNASRDGTAAMIAAEFPEVRLIVMPHDKYGACETFNIGFKASRTELTAILDDDIVMPPEWLEKATARMMREPPTTAILSTQVVEPGTPESYLKSPAVNAERYMSTFRGCASLARTHALREADFYDERLFIYGNERDLTCRLLNLGYRVLQYPGCGVFHKTPFGIKMGKRSLYYHARNAWLSMLKYAPLSDLAAMPWLVFSRVILRGEKKEAEGEVSDAVGTIGIGRSLRETKGAWWIVTKAAFSVLWNVPYCWKHRAPVTAEDFELPLR